MAGHLCEGWDTRARVRTVLPPLCPKTINLSSQNKKSLDKALFWTREALKKSFYNVDWTTALPESQEGTTIEQHLEHTTGGKQKQVKDDKGEKAKIGLKGSHYYLDCRCNRIQADPFIGWTPFQKDTKTMPLATPCAALLFCCVVGPLLDRHHSPKK